MWERNFSWDLHSIKENETNFLQNEINGPQNVLKLKANEMAESQNERKIKVNEIIFNQNDRTVKENEIKIKANDMTGPQNVRKFEQNEVMALQNDPTASTASTAPASRNPYPCSRSNNPARQKILMVINHLVSFFSPVLDFLPFSE